MFIGHFAVAFAAKKAAPRASLGTLVAATVFLDAVWPVLLLAGVESVRIAPGITAFSPFDFVSYPWSHSLAMAVFWAAVFGAIYAAVRKDAVAGSVLGGVVASHWILDWISHRPDMPLAPGLRVAVGLGLWNSVPATLAVEGAMFVIGAALYARATRAKDAVGRYGWAAYLATLVVLYLAGLGPPPHPGQERAVAWVSLAGLLFVPWAAWIDRHRSARPGPGQGAAPGSAPSMA